jgi:hypothetical protein
MKRGNYIVVPVVGVLGFVAGAFVHSRYAETEPSKATMEAAAIANARESARLQFERDIGNAKVELQNARETMQGLANQVLSPDLPQRMLEEQANQVRASLENFREKKARISFLRSEAVRLGIPTDSTAPTEDEKAEEPLLKQVSVDSRDMASAKSGPTLVTLKEPIEIQDPTSSETLKFGRGRTFRLVLASNNEVRVRYLDHEITIPAEATDLR